MRAKLQPAGEKWHGLRNATLLIGLLTGVFLSCTLIAWLWAANDMPQWYALANVRNLCGGGLIILAMAVPVFCFLRHPVQMFVSGLMAWAVLTATYLLLEMRYSLLESRMGALQVFMLGAISFGFVAVLNWVFLLCVKARHRHVTQITQGTIPETRHRVP